MLPLRVGILVTLVASVAYEPLRWLTTMLSPSLDEALGGIRSTVEDGILDVFEELGRDILVDSQLARIDDAHGQTSLYRVIEKYRVNGLAN